MPPVDNVSLSPYSADFAEIERKRALAQALQQQSMQPIEQSSVNGIPVPISPFQGLAKLLQGYNAGTMQKSAIEQQRALYDRQQADRSADLSTFARALAGTPGTPESSAGSNEPGDAPVVTPAVPGRSAGVFDRAAIPLLKDPQLQTLALSMLKPKDPVKVGPGESLVDTNTNKPVFTAPREPKYYVVGGNLVPEPTAPGEAATPAYSAPEKPQKTPADDLRAALIAAGIDPSGPQGRALFADLARKEATHQPPASTSVKIDNQMGQGIAKEIGPMIAESRGQALAAIDRAAATDRVLSALDSGKVIAGPGATLRVFGDQLSQMLGVGGDTTTERLQNTRQAIKGLAQLTLASRKQMKGQGAVSESEAKLAEKAESGDIDSLSLPEIRTLALASRKAAQETHSQYRTQLDNLRSNPNLSGLVPFFEVPAWPNAPNGPSSLSPTAQQYLERARPR